MIVYWYGAQLHSCGMGDDHRCMCFLKDEKTMRVYGAVGGRKSTNMDISTFPTSYYNPCQRIDGTLYV